MRKSLNARNQGGVGYISLPSASADVRPMCGRKTEDVGWGIIRKRRQKWPKWQKTARRWLNIASVSFRQLPRTFVGARDMCGRKTEDGRWEITIGTSENVLSPENRAGLAKYGLLQLPYASVRFRGRPRHVGGRQKRDAVKLRWEPDGKWHKWEKQGRGGRCIASVGFRQRPWTSVGIRSIRGRKT